MRSVCRHRRLIGVGAVVAAVVVLPGGLVQASDVVVDGSRQCQRTVSDLPLPAGLTNGWVSGTDGGSRFVGTAWTDQNQQRHGVVWDNGAPRVLGTGFGSTWLTDGNTSGTAVGFESEYEHSAAVRFRDGVYDYLPGLPDFPAGYAAGINRAGHIVGLVGGGASRVVIWRTDRPGAPRELELPEGERNQASHLIGIDDANRVVASTTTPRSYVWSTTGVRTQLAPLWDGAWVQARQISAGRIVGRSGDESGRIAAAEWDAAGRVVRTLPGGIDALAVNTNDLVLGSVEPHGSGQFAVWRDGELMGGVLPKPANAQQISARTITDAGVVAGSYTTDNTNRTVPAQWACA